MNRRIFFAFSMVLFCVQSMNAQCGWVGTMNFPGGPINAGSEYLVNVQVYQDGITNSAGQGSGISCYTHFGQVTSFGSAWTNVQTLAMNYDKDTGNNDEYKLDIGPSLTQGLWEYTCYCTCSGSPNQSWVGSNAQLTVNAPLPITLGEFTAKRNFDKVALFWSTLSEVNNHYFEVQFSSDGSLFEDLGIVYAKLSRNNHNAYEFIHESPSDNGGYYRLKQVDFDGKSTFSNIISVNSDRNNIIRVFPIPTSAHINIEGMGSNGHVLINDLSGRQIMMSEQTKTLDVSQLMPGIYMLRIWSDDAYQSFKLVKE